MNFDEHSDVVEVTREFIGLGETMKGKGDDQVRVYNPKYVTRQDKKELLFKILKNYHLETREREGMPFAVIKDVLKNRYGIDTRSTGDVSDLNDKSASVTVESEIVGSCFHQQFLSLSMSSNKRQWHWVNPACF